MARCLAALLAALAAASAAAQAGSGEWLQMPGARPKDAAESSPPVTPAAAHVLAVAVPPAPPCSRERSKLAAEITRAHVLAAAEAAGVALPEACPLHPSRAYFAKQDESRVKQGSKQWRCGACRKRFRSELYLEQHFDRRHASLVPPNAVCLADFCEILHCPPAAEAPGSPPRPCSDAEMEKQRLRCQVSVRARACAQGRGRVSRRVPQLLFDKCFPSHEGPASLKLHGERAAPRAAQQTRELAPHASQTPW
jgi:hypothetical protein